MTIAICLKVGDGVVFGADSASTLMSDRGVVNVYFNAEKIFNLRKGFSVGAVTYGLGGINGRSVTSLAKDLRERFTAPGAWHLDEDAYTMQEVAERLRRFFYEEHYLIAYPAAAPREPPTQESETADDTEDAHEVFPAMGFTVAGFSAGAQHAEVWSVEVDQLGRCPPPTLVFGEDVAGVVSWKGEPEAIQRLIFGYNGAAVERLLAAGVDSDDAYGVVMEFIRLAEPAMPIQDAIDLVHYLADVTVGFVRFRAGAPTVAPPIDLAAVTLHERFRWVKRKHYYGSELNPPLS